MLSLPQAGGFWPLCALFFTTALGGAIYWPTIEGIICEGRTREQIRRNLGTFNVLWSVGMAVGVLLTGTLYELRPSLPFHIAACNVGVLFVAFLLLPSPPLLSPQANDAPDQPEAARPQAGVSFLYLSRVMMFLCYFAVFNLRFLFPKYGEHLGFSESQVSLLLFVVLLSQTLTFLALRTTGFWHYRFWPLIVAAVVGSASFFVIGSVQNYFVLVLSFVFIGLFTGCCYFSGIYYSMARPKAGVESAAWHEATLALGAALGPIVGGAFADVTGSYAAPFFLSGAVMLIALGVTVQFFMRSVEARAQPGAGAP